MLVLIKSNYIYSVSNSYLYRKAAKIGENQI